MATLPTRRQQEACDHFAEALYLITLAARLDGRGTLNADDLDAIAGRIGRACPAFALDEIVPRALARRVAAMGLPSDTTELLTLMDADITPLEMLRLDDDAFRALVDRLQEELGDI